jgi:hypothetical protein
MQVDPEYLRRHYASLSDEALLDINAGDLVNVARDCFDAEIRRRRLASGREIPAEDTDNGDEFSEESDEPEEDEGEPDWLEDGTEVYSAMVQPGALNAPDADNARAALKGAGIPCYLEIYEEEPEEPASPQPTHRWRLLVPGKVNLQATNVLQRDIFNDAFESGWRAQLEVLSDGEVLDMNPQVVFCGLFDQIERVTRAYEEELSRRGLTE